jgi:hypothetical protein
MNNIVFVIVTIWAGMAVYNTLFRSRSSLERTDRADWIARLVAVGGISVLYVGFIFVAVFLPQLWFAATAIVLVGFLMLQVSRPVLSSILRARQGEDD